MTGVIFFLLVLGICVWFLFFYKTSNSIVPISVNYHFTRMCNFQCGFCFHTEKTSSILSLKKAKHGLYLLQQSGMKKLNFAGGEPFLFPRFVGELAKYAKEELHLQSVSIVTNTSLIRPSWFTKYGKYIDIVAMSCDSCNESTNKQMGRTWRKEPKSAATHVNNVRAAVKLCKKHGIMVKLNTVVNACNWEEDMNAFVNEMDPFRWKVFQVLPLKGENDETIDHFKISGEQFQSFLDRHVQQAHRLVPENNDNMRSSYLILDENMCFIDNSSGESIKGPSLLDVGVEKALQQSGFQMQKFVDRGGQYDWCKQDKKLEW